jgi:drug/metabolite transporter (DMT)-like permease
MLGSLLGLASTAVFAMVSIIARRGVLRVTSNYFASLSIYTSPFFFFLVTFMTGDLLGMDQIPLKAYIFWSLSGIVHLALGRTWAYRAVQLIGSNRSIVVMSLNPIVSLILAVIILNEPLTWSMVPAILLLVLGPVLVAWREQTLRVEASAGKPSVKDVDRHTLYKGMFFGAGAALFWGSSAIFIKLGLASGGTPIAGSFIAHLAAALAIFPSSFLNRQNRAELFQKDFVSLRLAILSGLTSCMAQLLRYLAFSYGSVIVVSLMARTLPLWVLLFAFIFNRKYESFSRWVLIGNAFIVVGTIWLFFA